jgi:MHS family proline/betaine transporter-like MFS transporter
MQTYLQSEVGFTFGMVSVSTVVCLCSAAVSIFAFARLSDRFGRKPIIIAGAITSTLVVFPAFAAFATADTALIVAAQAAMGICLAMFMSASGAAMVEIFPGRVRYAGISIGFNVSVALFSGTAPYESTWLISATGSPVAPSIILVATGLVAIVAAISLHETAGWRADERVEADPVRLDPIHAGE